MRKVSECKEFPYKERTTCYIFVKENGDVKQVISNKTGIEEIKEDLLNNKGKLYAVWPGNYSSDLFLVDDTKALLMAFGLYESKHIHDIEWNFSDFKKDSKVYAYIDCKLKCGCNIDKIGIRQFAADMKKQKNWDVCVTRYSGYGDEYTIQVKRSTLN